MKTQTSTKLIVAAVLLSLTMLLPNTLADSGGIPPGTYSVTITPADIPPEFPPEAADILVATWLVTLNEDGTTYATRDGEVVVIGIYTSNKSHIVIRDLGGPLACFDAHGIATGIYRWSLSGDELTATTVLDRCFGRNFVFTLRPLQRQ